ncbi:4Fe-4S dicluster domain-containing protein [Natranaerofaba carboxydovora]|uniref:4Fe-4S dicluster domain-containing protein n=1 Tax=Natranaerofaba carboxydovora TaxID=2742683 RepID=UPI003B84A53F
MGKKYRVPSSLTIMNALEYAGYKLIRGCGCRAGFCGACGTVYRTPETTDLKVGLACQTKVEEGMYLTQIPFFPAQRANYNIDELEPTGQQIAELYPEIMRCLGCNSCTKVCPQDLKVMKCISHVLRGDITKAADESFDCLMCGLCTSRCPAHSVQYNVTLLARRLYGKYIAPPAKHLADRVKEIEDGKYDKELEELMNASTDELKEKYNNRDMEK